MRQLIGVGTPRELQGRRLAVLASAASPPAVTATHHVRATEARASNMMSSAARACGIEER
jgi:hypothetical protein